MPFEQATRLKKLPPYLFAEIEDKVRIKRNEGLDIIDFGIGDPDLPTPSPIIEEIKKQLDDPENHRYPSSSGELDARQAVADWYERRFGVHLDPNGQVAILIGSSTRERRYSARTWPIRSMPRVRRRCATRSRSVSRCGRRTSSCPTLTVCRPMPGCST
jgi:hypothetical protein